MKKAERVSGFDEIEREQSRSQKLDRTQGRDPLHRIF